MVNPLLPTMRLRDMFTSPAKKEHTKALFRYCIDIMQEVALYKEHQSTKDFQVCTGAVYILTKLVGYIMKDPRAEEEYMWSEMALSGPENELSVPLAIKFATSIVKLLFKPGYTIRPYD